MGPEWQYLKKSVIGKTDEQLSMELFSKLVALKGSAFKVEV